MVTGTASETEAAAIVAALEQFLTETTPAAPPVEPAQSPWQRAALHEGVSARGQLVTPVRASGSQTATNRRT
jgi:hypothetical protein